MRTNTTLRHLLLRDRKSQESRNAQAIRMGFSEGSLRMYEQGALPHGNTIPALARALKTSEERLRKIVEAERHAEHGESAPVEAIGTEGART